MNVTVTWPHSASIRVESDTDSQVDSQFNTNMFFSIALGIRKYIPTYMATVDYAMVGVTVRQSTIICGIEYKDLELTLDSLGIEIGVDSFCDQIPAPGCYD